MKLRTLRYSVAVAVVLVGFGAAVAHGEPADTPKAFVESLAQRVVHALNDRELSEQGRLLKFRTLFEEGLALPAIGRFVLGRYWRRATRDERKTYQSLFEDYVVAIYASRLGRYQGETVRVVGTRKDGGHDTVVSTEILSEGKPTTRVDWRVRRTPGRYKILDVVVEGISMAITQRSEFAAVIQQNGGRLDGLLSQLRAKASKN
jgi:phospholipid transport system substrate-binding protein